MKTLNNSNLTLTQVLQSVVSQSVNDILIQEGIKSGDENPVKGLTDVKKKGAIGKIVYEGEAPDNQIAIKLDSGEVVNVEVDRGWYRIDEATGGNNYDENQSVEIDYDPAGNAYIIATNKPPKAVIIKSVEFAQLKVGDNNSVQVFEDEVRLGNNTGTDSGLVLVKELTDKINELVDAINQLATAFKSHTHNVTTVGAPAGPVTPPYVGTFNKFNKADYENTKIVQYK